MDSSLQASYAHLTKHIDDYIKANDLDIILTRVKSLFDEVLSNLSSKIKKNIEEVEEMQKFMNQSYHSLKSDSQPWKVAMFRSLEDEMRKKIGQKTELTRERIKELLITELDGLVQEEKPDQVWFEELYKNKEKQFSEGHQLLMQARSAEYQEKFQQAFDFYAQAKAKGSVLAAHALAAYHENGYHVKQDIHQAMNLYREAAALHSTSSLNALGRLFQKGIGVQADQKRAQFYFKVAAEQGQTRSWANLYEMKKEGDPEKAKLYKQTTKDSVPVGFN